MTAGRQKLGSSGSSKREFLLHSRTGHTKGDFQSLKDRMYNCNICGPLMDRDVNASINMLKRAALGQGGSHVQGDSARPQKEAVVEELKTYSASKEWNP